MKRFYDAVRVRETDGGWQVVLDSRESGRDVRTTGGAAQVVPTRALAQALAAEWDGQGETNAPASFPLRDLADYAIDVVARDPEAVVDKLLRYAETDTLLYRADPDEPLFARQIAEWEPIVAAFEAREGVVMMRVSGIVYRAQEDASMARLRDRLSALSPFALAAIEVLASLSASLIIALEAARPDADGTMLWRAASLEEEWQAELWGRDEEAEERRATREAQFVQAAEWARLAVG